MDDPEPSSLLLTFLSISPDLYLTAGVLILLLFLIYIISSSEIAILSLTPEELETNHEKYPSKTKLILKIKRNPERLIYSVQTLRILIIIGIITLYISFSQAFITNFNYSEYVRIAIDITFICIILMFTGVIIPRIYAQKNTLVYSYKTIGLVNFINKLFYPITNLFIYFTHITEKFKEKDKHIGVDNLTQALEIAAEDKNTSDTEQKILEGIVNFGTIETRQVMTPRIDVFSVQKDLPFNEVLQLVTENGYSRIPVYNKDIDDIIGVLYAKDLIQYLNNDNFEWNTLLKKAYFIPENKKIDDLLTDFKNRKIHLAIVVDEYGGTSGIVSLEDVIEEIVGEINDEFDEDDISYSKIDETTYVFEGKTSLIDFFRVMNIDEKEFEDIKGEADTLAGLVLELAEEFPKRLQKIFYKNFLFQVESLDRKRLKQIKVSQQINEENNNLN